MSNYMRALPVAVAVGNLADGTSEYESGERLVIQMNQFFNALGRPSRFEPAVQAVWASYEKHKLNWFTDGAIGQWFNATAMKNVGIDAARVTAEMQKAFPDKSALVPSDNIPKPNENNITDAITKYIPWIIGGVAVLGVGVYVVPLVTPMIMARMVQRKAAA